ncbi:MAG: helix-turn-helix transcriptional regulator [Eubacteriales bacterium]|nr:helix-turn-helix transcriptional regulator [Eubacteriales bacterium]
MPIYFRNAPVAVPFMYDSVGNHWTQARTERQNGYPYYHYLQTEEGAGRIEIRGSLYTLSEGEGILIAPSLPHSYTKISDSWITMFATFTGTLASGIPSLVQNRPVILIDRERGRQIQEIIFSAVSMHEQPLPDIQALSLSCYSLLLKLGDPASAGKLLENPLYLQYIAPVVKEIETHYYSELTADSLSRMVYVSPQYLSRLFRRFLGCSVYEYLTMYRINRAKELLVSDPDRKIQDIAQAVGFTHSSHFISMFRKATGITPLDFRKMY